jgi:endonuclease III
MSTISKTKKIEMLQRALHRRYKWQEELPERNVLEHLVYAALLENAPSDIATTAYEVLESYFIDWNEVRVTTTPELAEIIAVMPDPTGAADRVRRALRGVFEKTYMFSLEELKKKGKSLAQAITFLKSLGTLSYFMADYVTQFALGGHVIPLDESTLRIFRMLDLAQVNKERTEEYVPGIERAISKKNGITFSMELHNFAYSLCKAMDSGQEPNEHLTVLKNIDTKSLTRDYTPPALTIPKPPKERKLLPTTVHIPFGVTGDDDDFDEEHNGAEVDFLPSGLSCLDDGYDADEEVKAKPKKKTPNEKPIPTKIEKSKQTTFNQLKPKTPTTAPPQKNDTTKIDREKKTEQKTLIAPIDKTVKDTNKTKDKDKDKNKVADKNKNKPTPPAKTTSNTRKPENKTGKNTAAQKDSKPIKKIAPKDDKAKNNLQRSQKTVVAKPSKNVGTNSAKNIDKKKLEQTKLKKTTKDEKQKPSNKQKENNKKIVKVISKESRSVTKQLQKKRPK